MSDEPGLNRLVEEWEQRKFPLPNEHWQGRITALTHVREAIETFLKGDSGVEEFRHRIDSLSKSEGEWGFRGGGQMFFNMVIKAADSDEFGSALRTAIRAPNNVADARACMGGFIAFVETARLRAHEVGVTPPTVGHIPYFLTFFWESEKREEWPIYYPASRNVLAKYGLFDESGSLVDRYLRYRDIVHQLRTVLGTDTWGVESLLWQLHQSATTDGKPKAQEDKKPSLDAITPTNIYSWYRTQSLIFPEELITTFVLSLLTKRFVILSGISGTGKTQIALSFAKYLEAVLGAPRVVEATPEDTDEAIHLRLTDRRIARGYVNLRKEQLDFFDVSNRGTSQTFSLSMPDGDAQTIRVNNIGFTDAAREMVRVNFARTLREWVASHAVPGDYIRLALNDQGVPTSLSVFKAQAQNTDERVTRHVLIPVRSDWTDPRGLIGYHNPITHRYASTPFLDLLLDALDDPSNPYLVILDEMNLARVEYYFSDFLSALESGEPVTLKPADNLDEDEDERTIPSRLAIPSNVLFVGTVNVDETTHAFSPKVLDRANVLEFNEVFLDRVLADEAEPAPSNFRFSDPALSASASALARSGEIHPDAYDRARSLTAVTEALATVEDILERYNRHFGYRVIKEILHYVAHAVDLVDGDEDEVGRTALDLQFVQKVLPKLNGGRELEEPLVRLLDYCVNGERSTADTESVIKKAEDALLVLATETATGVDASEASATGPEYPRATRKLVRMIHRLRYTGFVSYLE